MTQHRPGTEQYRPGHARLAALVIALAALFGGALVATPALANFDITVVSTDVDRTPLGNFPGPEDTDVNNNGTYDNGLVPIEVGWRWMVELDTTKAIEPGSSCLGETPEQFEECLSVNFHTSYAPPLTKGHAPNSSTAVLTSDRRYYVSVLPDSGYAIGGAQVAPGQTSVQIIVQPEPLPTAQIRVFVFNDNAPINNVPDMPEELGLAGFKITLEEAGGKYGASAGTASQDCFGNPLGTSYPCGDSTCPQPPTGPIVTDADGYVTLKNLAPAKYGISVVPPTGGECPAGWSGSGEWQQTATIEGTHIIDAWVKANEPPFFVEFGPPGPHVFVGFTQD